MSMRKSEWRVMTHVTDRSQLCKMASQCSQSALQCSKTPATPAAKKKYVDYHGREGVSAYLQREDNCVTGAEKLLQIIAN